VFLGELSGIVYAIRQKTRLRIVEFVPKTPLEELTNHCEGEHADVCERLACLSPESGTVGRDGSTVKKFWHESESLNSHCRS